MKGRVIALLPFFMPTLHIGGRSLGKKLCKLLSLPKIWPPKKGAKYKPFVEEMTGT